jgi:hypothetical protein
MERGNGGQFTNSRPGVRRESSGCAETESEGRGGIWSGLEKHKEKTLIMSDASVSYSEENLLHEEATSEA